MQTTPIYEVGKKSIGPLMDRLDAGNIVRFYQTMPPAWQGQPASWYPRYAKMVTDYAIEHGVGIDGALGAFAILSSGASPDTNFALLESMIAHLRYGASLDYLPATPAAVGKALSCLACNSTGFVSGPKVTSYLHSLQGEEWDPCIDRHAIAVALGMANQGVYKISPAMYGRIQDCYRQAAIELGRTAREVQEWTWVWRKAILDDIDGIVTDRADLGELVDLAPLGWA